jgi:hypothetical protein
MYVVGLKVPKVFTTTAHTHCNDDNVTVPSGSCHIGAGDNYDEVKGDDQDGSRRMPAAQGAAVMLLTMRVLWGTAPPLLTRRTDIAAATASCPARCT